MSYLTRFPGVPDSDDVKAGMAHFENSGPFGKTCGTCVHRGYWRAGKSKVNPRTGLIEEKLVHSKGCRMFVKLTHRHGPAVNKDWRV
jgi:hypothetical protein